MRNRMRWVGTFVLLASWATCGVAVAVPPKVNDEANFFSAGAQEQANQKIKTLQKDCRKDLLIETIPSVPTNLPEKIKSLETSKMFVELGKTRAQSSEVKGVYVLICRKPPQIVVNVDEATQRNGFTNDQRKALIKTIKESLEAKQPDQALQRTVDAVDASIRASLAKPGGAVVKTASPITAPWSNAAAAPCPT